MSLILTHLIIDRSSSVTESFPAPVVGEDLAKLIVHGESTDGGADRLREICMEFRLTQRMQRKLGAGIIRSPSVTHALVSTALSDRDSNVYHEPTGVHRDH